MSYAQRDPEWIDDELMVDAIAKRVEHVSEVAKYQFPFQLRWEVPSIDWEKIVGMRDRLVHDYDRLDREILRQVVNDDLPRLVRILDRLLPE